MKSLLSLFVILLCVVPAAQAATITYAPSPAVPGQSVTLAGQAAPNTFMSFYLGSTHVGVANVNARGQYRHTFTVPANLRPGEVRLSGGCDKCGNGWQAIPLKLAAAGRPAAAPDPARYKPAVEAAYGKWLGRAPNPQELDYWTKALAGRARTEASMHQSHQAHLRQHERDATIKRSYQAVFKRDPNEGELNFWRGHVQSGRAWYENMVQGHRDYLATTEKRRQEELAAGQARRTAWAAKFLNKRGKPERCFGAIGPGCDGAPLAGTERLPDGNFRTLVAVGSILHDNCCVRNPDGFMCGGSQNNIADISQLRGQNDGLACAKEWRKAVYNNRDGRKWTHVFAAYVDGDLSDKIGNDITPRSGRQTKMADAGGNFIYTYDGGETPTTLALCAPPGTKLDADDVQFCCSRQFSGTYWAPGVSNWGDCR